MERHCHSWESDLQTVVVFSTTKVEYITITKAIKEEMWLLGIINAANPQSKLMIIELVTS